MTVGVFISVLESLYRCLPPGWELHYDAAVGLWRLYGSTGEYYGEHCTPEEALKAALGGVTVAE